MHSGIGYSAPIIAKPRECNPNDVKMNITISTQLEVGVIEPAQEIPLVANGVRPPYYGNVKLDVDKENPKGQQTFFQRYWYSLTHSLTHSLAHSFTRPPGTLCCLSCIICSDLAEVAKREKMPRVKRLLLIAAQKIRKRNNLVTYVF